MEGGVMRGMTGGRHPARAGDGPGAAEQMAARLLTGALGGEADHAR